MTTLTIRPKGYPEGFFVGTIDDIIGSLRIYLFMNMGEKEYFRDKYEVESALIESGIPFEWGE